MNRTEGVMEPETSHGEVVPPQIEELLRSRSTLVEWLEGLEDRREDVRPAVYEKVRDDYRGRLAEVEGQLAEHRSDLERALEERREAVGELEEERDAQAALLEEAELRHDVGELEDDEWEEESGELKSELDELDESLDEERAAVDRLEDVLDELTELAVDEEPTGDAGSRGGEPSARPGGEADPAAEVDEPGPDVAGTPAGSADVEEPAPADAGQPTEPPADGDTTTGREETAGDAEADGSGGPAGARDEAAAERAAERPGPDEEEEGEPEDRDELDFLESLALDDPEGLDTLSLELDEEEDDDGRDGEPGG